MTQAHDIDYIDGEPTPGLLRLQQTQLDILRQVAEFCAERDIEFFLTAGTALGAARHQGFIPWDDDIDIGMLREDYERFAATFNSEGPDGLVFQNDETDADYFEAFGKVRMLNTYFDEPINHGLDYAQGIFIDVFPYDVIPNSKVAARVQLATLSALSMIIMSRNPDVAISDIRWLQLARRAAAKIRPLFPIRLLERARRWVSIWPVGSRSDAAVSYEMLGIRHWRWSRVPLDALLPTTVSQFGDFTMPVPADQDQFLSTLYGDYNKFPAPEQQRPRHTGFVNFESDSRSDLNSRPKDR